MTLLEYFLSALWLRACYLACALLPVKADKAVFASARAEKLEGNLLFVYNEMRRQRPDFEYVLLLERYSYSLLGKLKYLAKLTRSSYHLATARYFIVDNAYLPLHVGPHRKGTTVVQVWHAAGALKKFGMDVTDPNREVENRFVHRYYDLVVVGSEWARAPYASALRTDISRVVALGTARTDMLLDDGAVARARDRFFAEYPQLVGKKIVLYAPTFRGQGAGKHSVDALDARLLKQRLGGEWAFVHKTHPVMAAASSGESGYDAVIGTDYDLNELFCVADVFVTDYSSAIFEWALLRKPLVLLVEDLADYEKNPGFYLDFRKEMIGEFAKTTDDVAQLLATSSWDFSGYDDFLARHCPLDDGHASERVVDWLLHHDH